MVDKLDPRAGIPSALLKLDESKFFWIEESVNN